MRPSRRGGFPFVLFARLLLRADPSSATLDPSSLDLLGLDRARGPGGGEDDPDDEPVERERLGEDEDEEHAREELGLLRVGADARVADDADGHARGEAGEAARQAGAEVGVPLEEGVRWRNGVEGRARGGGGGWG